MKESADTLLNTATHLFTDCITNSAANITTQQTAVKGMRLSKPDGLMKASAGIPTRRRQFLYTGSTTPMHIPATTTTQPTRKKTTRS